MDFISKIKKYFPFTPAKKDVKSLVVAVAIYLVAGIVAGTVIGIFAPVFILGVLFGIVGALVDIYCIVGITITVLDFLGK